MKLISFEKKLGLPGAVCVTVGAVIGVGIFVIVGEIGGMAGSWTPLAFLLAGVGAVFGTLVAISLGSTIPADGGGFYYTKCLLGQGTGRVASWLIVVGALGSVGTVSLGVADYLAYFLPAAESFPSHVRVLLAIGLILGTWGINALGIMASEKLQIGMVVQLASALLILVVFVMISGHAPDFSQNQPESAGIFFFAGALAMLSYTGFNIIGELGDEIENPRRNIPLTITIGLGIIIFIYVGIGWIVAGTLETADAMRTSKAALLDTALSIELLQKHRWFIYYLDLAAVFGAVTSINAVFLAVPREFSAQADAGLLPPWIMKFNPRRQTFPVGMAIVAIVGCIIVIPNFRVGTYGYLCVAGLLLANVLFSVGVLRLFKLYPDKVATAPIPIRKWWLFPAAVISTFISLGFGLLAVYGFAESIIRQVGGG